MEALLVIDIQKDFCAGGSLSVTGAEEIIKIVNDLMPRYDLVVASQDWHPQNHLCFAVNHHNRKVGDLATVGGKQQTLWPVHCVANTSGAELHPGLAADQIGYLQKKGMSFDLDSYSAFFDNDHRHPTGLDAYLKTKKVVKLVIVGLATDYCVKYTVLDALKLGYEVTVIKAACRAVNLQPDDEQKALACMAEAGAKIR